MLQALRHCPRCFMRSNARLSPRVSQHHPHPVGRYALERTCGGWRGLSGANVSVTRLRASSKVAEDTAKQDSAGEGPVLATSDESDRLLRIRHSVRLAGRMGEARVYTSMNIRSWVAQLGAWLE